MTKLVQRIPQAIRHKLFIPVMVVASVMTVGSVATVSANHTPAHQGPGYAFDQCKNGGWRNFKNPDGSQKFRNQGQCIAFFATGGTGTPPQSSIIRNIINAIVNFLTQWLNGFLGIFK